MRRRSGAWVSRRRRHTTMPSDRRKLEDAAVAWWEYKRPAGWSEEAHLLNPAINTRDSRERALAMEVAIVVAARRKSRPR